MNKQCLTLASMVAVLLAINVGAQETNYQDGWLIVKPIGATNTLDAIHSRLESQVVKSYPRFGHIQVLKLRSGFGVVDAMEEYHASGLVHYAEPNYIGAYVSTTHPNDTSYVNNSLWNLDVINAPEAWHFRTDAQPAIVGIIDTGVNYTHPDLAANMWVNLGEVSGDNDDDDGNNYNDDVFGYDFHNNNSDPMGADDHGSHVAGIVGAVGNNGLGVVGVAWNVRIMALASQGSVQTTTILPAIDYAIAEGAHILNASWAFRIFSQPMLDAIRAAGNSGIIFVAAAGNDGSNSDDDDPNAIVRRYPAAFDADNIVSVAATLRDDSLASYSNYGLTTIDLAAPGGVATGGTNAVLSTSLGSNYERKGGTSMAAPHVAGALALLKVQFPGESYFQLINRLFSSTDSLPALAGKCVTGGRLNLHKALTSTSSSPKNDRFTNSYAIAVPSGQQKITGCGNNVDATTESGEPSHAGAFGGHSVWWHWAAPATTGTVEIRTEGTTFNTRLAVYTGSIVTNLTLVASNAVTDSCSWSKVNFTYSTGVTYRIAVDGYNGAVGSIKLTVQTNSSTTINTLAFDRSTAVWTPASGGGSPEFAVTIQGPASQSVTLEKRTPAALWASYASFTLSSQGLYTFTDEYAEEEWALYRCQVSSLGLKSCNAVGYSFENLPAGYAMIANQFSKADSRLNAVLPGVPNGTYLHKFNEVTDAYYEVNGFVTGTGWVDTNMTLSPGEGAIIQLPSSTTISFAGECLQGYVVNPVVSGHSIRSAKAPVAGPVASGLGTPIVEGDIVVRMISGAYHQYAYHNGLWIKNNQQVAETIIKMGESFWVVKPANWQQISSVWP